MRPHILLAIVCGTCFGACHRWPGPTAGTMGACSGTRAGKDARCDIGPGASLNLDPGTAVGTVGTVGTAFWPTLEARRPSSIHCGTLGSPVDMEPRDPRANFGTTGGAAVVHPCLGMVGMVAKVATGGPAMMGTQGETGAASGVGTTADGTAATTWGATSTGAEKTRLMATSAVEGPDSGGV